MAALIAACAVLTSCQRPPSRAGARSSIAAEIKRLRAEIKQHPNEAFNHEQLAVLLSGTGDTAGALKEIHTAIKLAPDNVGYHFTLGTMYEKQGKNQLALKSYESSVRLMEQNSSQREQAPLFYSSLARTYDVTHKPSEAIRYYNKALDSLQWPEINSRFTEDDKKEMESRIKSRLDDFAKTGA